MGRLAGLKYREVARKLRALGFAYDRPGPGNVMPVKASSAKARESFMARILRGMLCRALDLS